jgi:hypothetical protein
MKLSMTSETIRMAPSTIQIQLAQVKRELTGA